MVTALIVFLILSGVSNVQGMFVTPISDSMILRAFSIDPVCSFDYSKSTNSSVLFKIPKHNAVPLLCMLVVPQEYGFVVSRPENVLKFLFAYPESPVPAVPNPDCMEQGDERVLCSLFWRKKSINVPKNLEVCALLCSDVQGDVLTGYKSYFKQVMQVILQQQPQVKMYYSNDTPEKVNILLTLIAKYYQRGESLREDEAAMLEGARYYY